MILLKDMKKGLYLNANKYWLAHAKDKINIAGFELKIGTRLRASVAIDGKNRKFYMVVISLDPAVIAYWIQGEYAIYLAPVNFDTLFNKRDIERRTMQETNIHPTNFRYFTIKTPASADIREMLWILPRLTQTDVQSTPHSLVIKTPKLIYDIARFVTADKEDIKEWLFSKAIASRENYHTGKKQSDLTDDEYDDLKEFLQILDPPRASRELDTVGAKVPKNIRKKVTLENPMGSLVKIKPDGVSTAKFLNKTKDKYYVLSDKLDGLSLALKYVNGDLTLATTRGDGLIGQDVTRHVQYINSIPKKLGSKFKSGVWNIRCEVILTTHDFETLKKEIKDAGGKEYTDARGMVSGAINRNVPNQKVVAKVNVIAYSIMNHPEMDKKEQLETLKTMGFKVVNYVVLKAKEVSETNLTDYIIERRKNGGFDMDGGVLEVNSAKIRINLGTETNSLNPASARAFKIGDTEQVEATVVKVEWRVSKHGKIKPRIRIKPTRIGGVIVTYATAFNAAYILDNKIGPKAKLLLTRSGDVIPHILKVITSANEAQMPDPNVVGEYDWNDTEVDLILTKPEEHEMVNIKRMTAFFKGVGVDFLGNGTITKLYSAGIDTIDAVVNITIPQLMEIDGIKTKSAEKIYKSITEALAKVDLPTLAAATPFFGMNFGIKRMNAIYKVYKEDMFNWKGHTVGEVTQKIADINNFDKVMAKQFARGVKTFNKFIKRNSSRIHIQEKKGPLILSNSFEGVSVCWTKVRQHELEDLLIKNGGTVATSVKKGLTYLVAKDPNTPSAKLNKARELGVEVISPEDLIYLFKLKGIRV